MGSKVTLILAIVFCGVLMLTPSGESQAATEMTIATFHPRTGTADVEGLSGLMSEDHTFVDSGGGVSSGIDSMAKGWSEYFRMFPDYRITVDDIIQDGSLVAVFGSAFGTYNGNRGPVLENRIEMPAAWRAIVENGKVKVWQVYADWTEGWKVIEEDKKQG